MLIGGLQKLTLVDYPGKVAATVFLIGCNFRCGFCHNPDLVRPDARSGQPQVSEADFFEFLKKKEGLIEGVCITGGEPTIYPELINFIKKIKNRGFLVKLDTNGSNPEVLEKLLTGELLSFVAMDIKTSADVQIQNQKSPASPSEAGRAKIKKYDKVTNVSVDIDKIKKSVKLIKNSGVDYEFRTTVVPGLVDKEDIKKIAEWLNGAKKFVLQQFRNQKVLDKKFEKIRPYPDEILKEFGKILGKNIKEIELRL